MGASILSEIQNRPGSGAVALIAVGANLPSAVGPPEATISAAFARLACLGRVRARSALYDTPAWPDPTAPAYINAAVRVETVLPPDALMAALLDIEANVGRARRSRWESRPLDLDLIDYAGVVRADDPILPHPRAHQRAFVLIPLRDVAPIWRRPGGGEMIAALIKGLPEADRASVRRRGGPA